MSNRNLLVILLSIICSFISAQDILLDKKGNEEKVKILEINPTEVKYKKFENLDGPLFVKTKSEIFMILFQDGTKEVFGNSNELNTAKDKEQKPDKEANPNQTKIYTLLDEATPKIRGGVALTCIGGGIAVVSLALGASFYSEGLFKEGDYTFAIGLPLSVPFFIAGPILIGKGKAKRREAKILQRSVSFSSGTINNEIAFLQPGSSQVIPSIKMTLNF